MKEYKIELTLDEEAFKKLRMSVSIQNLLGEARTGGVSDEFATKIVCAIEDSGEDGLAPIKCNVRGRKN